MGHVNVKKINDEFIILVLFTYVGSEDPVQALDEAIRDFTDTLPANQTYREFIDMNMDNPWERILYINNR